MSNLLILTYEELKADLPKAIKEIADFLGEDMSEENIAKLCDHVSIDKMRVNPMVNDSQYSLEVSLISSSSDLILTVEYTYY